MGRVIETYTLADGRRLELDAGPFYRHGVLVPGAWWLMGADGRNIDVLDHEEVVYVSCDSNAECVTSDSAVPR